MPQTALQNFEEISDVSINISIISNFLYRKIELQPIKFSVTALLLKPIVTWQCNHSSLSAWRICSFFSSPLHTA